MNAERWQQIESIFHSALALEGGARAEYLAGACAGDRELQQEVESLLATYEKGGGFINVPAHEVAARLLAANYSVSEEGRKGDSIKLFAAPGTLLGRYEIRSQIGAGGMGEVYRAHDTKLGRDVAIKILPAIYSAETEHLRRFEQEARAAGSLNHPNILAIYDIGTHDGVPYIVSELLEGETLRQRITGGSREGMKLEEVLDVAVQIAAALSAAHAAGIVHRDIKPENIMVGEDALVKVLDFGLAKLTRKPLDQERLDVEAATVIHVQTEPGVVMGTVSYMSPEQARGQAVDERSDIWSLGVVLYEMTTGHAPFGNSVALILEEAPPPLARYSRGIPIELERIVTKALAKQRGERYQTAKALITDLRRLRPRLGAETEGRRLVPTRETADRTTRRQGCALTWLVVFAALAGSVALWMYEAGRRAKPTAPTAPFRVESMKRLTAVGKVADAVISPDGKYIAYTINDSGRQSLWIKHVGPNTDTLKLPPQKVSYKGLTFSPDSDYIYYVVYEDSHIALLYRVPVLGGAPRELLTDIDSPVTFSPDGNRIAFVRGYPNQKENALTIANADGTGEQKLAVRKSSSYFSIQGPAWSPDGVIIACSVHETSETGAATEMVVAVQVADGDQRTIGTQRWRWVGRLAWFGDGSGLAMPVADQTSIVTRILQLSYPGGEARNVTTDLGDYKTVSMTRDSKAMLTVQEERLSSIWVAPNGDVNRAKPITPEAGRYYSVSWTPDDKLVSVSIANGNPDVWIMSPDGGDQRQLTDDSKMEWASTVSPDGRYIVFLSYRAGSWSIWRMDVDGRNHKQLTDGNAHSPSCSPVRPDGQWVVYQSRSSGKPTLWKVPIDGGPPVQLTSRLSGNPVVSPDGKLIACEYNDEQPNSGRRVVIIPFEGIGAGQTVRSIENIPTGSPVRWRPDGRSLTYINTRDNVSNVWGQPLAGGPPKQLTNFKDNEIFNFDWSHDGKQLACIRGTSADDVVLISGSK